MEKIEWSRPMAPLLFALNLSAMSKLPSASSKPPSTTTWHSFNPLKKWFHKKNQKFFVRPDFFNINDRIISH